MRQERDWYTRFLTAAGTVTPGVSFMLAQSMAQRRACMTRWPPDSAHGLLFELLGVGFFAATRRVARYKTGQIENSRQPC
ncbi:hypothetical protein Veis_3894 [Verminephrobacter eiseniae EF01-2]|uniref:Uncharacterized protein n=1 Tax=Verminephrobacter eiseniae (strain EF01-2) TaxID=391735 RepID=A1WPP4_VEREI|nr:hypothetical protein Veis_3894 [Verminephrobacter eiseniae EF01-2]